MSLNQIINPVKPLDVVFNNITAANLPEEQKEIIQYNSIPINDFTPQNNISSLLFEDSKLWIQEMEKTNKAGVFYNTVKIFGSQINITSTGSIDPVNQDKLSFNLVMPTILQAGTQVLFVRGSASGQVNNGLSQSFVAHLQTQAVGVDTLRVDFVSNNGVVLPSQPYYLDFELILITPV